MSTIAKKTNFFFSFLAYQKNLIPHCLTLRRVEFFEIKIPISSRKRIFHQNRFSLFIRGPCGLDSQTKKMLKNLVTLPL